VHHDPTDPNEGEMAPHTDRYVPADTNAGWGFATFILLLTAAIIIAATLIHKATYKNPTDVTWHGKGSGDAAPVGDLGG
jgi:hypothetical protein